MTCPKCMSLLIMEIITDDFDVDSNEELTVVEYKCMACDYVWDKEESNGE